VHQIGFIYKIRPWIRKLHCIVVYNFLIQYHIFSMWWLHGRNTQFLQGADKSLAEIRRSSKISSWIWSIICGVVTVLVRPERGASQVEKSPRLNDTVDSVLRHREVGRAKNLLAPRCYMYDNRRVQTVILLRFFICVEVSAWNSFLMYAGHKLVAVTIRTEDASSSAILLGWIQLSVLQYSDMLRHGKTLKVLQN